MFSNKEIATNRDIIFGHDAAFNLPAAFANRYTSRKFLINGINHSPQVDDGSSNRISVVSDLLGAGKTFLVEMVLNELKIDIDARTFLMCGKNKPERMSVAAERGPLFIDEWDSRRSPRTFIRALDWLDEFCSKSDSPIVLLGDLTLKSDNIIQHLEQWGPVHAVPMEPLDPLFFKLALKQRVAYAFPKKFSAEEIADPSLIPDSSITFLDDRLLTAVVPDWVKSTPSDQFEDLPRTNATFRDVFRALHNLSQRLPLDDAECQIGESEVQSYLRQYNTFGDLSGEQRRLVGEVVKHGRDSLFSAEIDPRLSSEFLRKACGSNLDDESFAKEVLDPLARNTIISAIGFPTIVQDDYRKYPGPFLPGTLLRIISAFGDVE